MHLNFHILGFNEVEVLDRKLKEANAVNLEFYRLSHSSLFTKPPSHLEEDFQSIAEDISAWPNVSNFILLKFYQYPLHMHWCLIFPKWYRTCLLWMITFLYLFTCFSNVSISGWKWIHTAVFDIVILPWQFSPIPAFDNQLNTIGLFYSAPEISRQKVGTHCGGCLLLKFCSRHASDPEKSTKKLTECAGILRKCRDVSYIFKSN